MTKYSPWKPIQMVRTTGSLLKTVHLLHVQKPINSVAKPISLVSSMDYFESGFETDGFRKALKIFLKKAWDDLDVDYLRAVIDSYTKRL
uniref:Uncharacterized protein n=1 Tax=Caenorhabditis japonica TaxID=281687 RepID=A0A8R1IDB1_CAEJA